MLFKGYLLNIQYVKDSLNEEELNKFEQTLALFQKYGKQYDFDWLLLAALSYQESGIDQSKKSHAGAIGAMQLLPSTAKDKNVNIPDIDKIESNIHAGTKYLHFMIDRFFVDEKIDTLNRSLLAFAAYNAGPAKVDKLRKEAASMGLDPNIWSETSKLSLPSGLAGRLSTVIFTNITMLLNSLFSKRKRNERYQGSISQYSPNPI